MSFIENNHMVEAMAANEDTWIDIPYHSDAKTGDGVFIDENGILFNMGRNVLQRYYKGTWESVLEWTSD